MRNPDRNRKLYRRCAREFRDNLSDQRWSLLKEYRSQLGSAIENAAQGAALETLPKPVRYDIARRLRLELRPDGGVVTGLVLMEAVAPRRALNQQQLIILVHMLPTWPPSDALVKLEAMQDARYPDWLRRTAAECAADIEAATQATSNPARRRTDRNPPAAPLDEFATSDAEYWMPVLEWACHAVHSSPTTQMASKFRELFAEVEEPEPLAIVGVLATLGHYHGPFVGVIDPRMSDQLVDRLNDVAARWVGISDEEAALPPEETPRFEFPSTAIDRGGRGYIYIMDCFAGFDAWLQTRHNGYRFIYVWSESDWETGFVAHSSRVDAAIEALNSFGFRANLPSR